VGLDESRQDGAAVGVEVLGVRRQGRRGGGRARVKDASVAQDDRRVRDGRGARPVHELAVADDRGSCGSFHGFVSW